MKNIQIIDGAVNSVFEVYEIEDTTFDLIFSEGKDVVFISDLDRYLNSCQPENEAFWEKIYSHRKDKKTINGIHGTLHLDGSNCKKEYFPDGKELLVIKHLINW